jgi:hypothetical protein
MSIITKGLIGIEDMSLGTSTFSRTTSTGGTNILTQVDFVRQTSTNTQTLTGGLSIGGSLVVTGNISSTGTNTANIVVSKTANPAGTGIVRLANVDSIKWRNFANGGDILLGLNGAANGNIPADLINSQNGFLGPFISPNAAVSVTGALRLASTDTVSWRNNANGADIPLGKNASDQLTFNSQVVPSETAVVDLTAQTAAIADTTLFTPSVSGLFRISAYLKITTTGTSPVLGPVTIKYTDATDSVAQSVVMAQQLQTGAMSSTGNNGNTTTSVLTGSLVVNAKAAVAITYAVALTGTIGSTQYEVHIKCEAL